MNLVTVVLYRHAVVGNDEVVQITLWCMVGPL